MGTSGSSTGPDSELERSFCEPYLWWAGSSATRTCTGSWCFALKTHGREKDVRLCEKPHNWGSILMLMMLGSFSTRCNDVDDDDDDDDDQMLLLNSNPKAKIRPDL